MAAIQVERHDLAFPIIKEMNEHLRKRYESDFQITRGSSRGHGKRNKRSAGGGSKNNYLGTSESKSNGRFLGIHNEHVRKPTWSTDDLIAGFARMQAKQAESKKRKKKEKDKTKVKAKFPEPPPGQFFNAFGESVTPSDILYAFQFVDLRNDRKITIDEMQIACDRLNIDKPEKMYGYLNVNNNDSVDFNDWKQALSEKKSKLKPFWYAVLGGKALELSPLPVDYDIDDANQLLSDGSSADQNARILALHSITRKMCMKLSEEKFHKLYKKCLSNIITQLYDRNNYVIREACICLGKIMIARRAQYVKFAVKTLEALYEIIKINDEKIHISAHQAAKVLIRFIPDSKKFPIFAIVSRGCTDKSFLLTRNSSFEYVNHILARMVQVDQQRNDRFWAYMEKVLDSGLSDANQDVRDAAYSALAKTELLRKDLAMEYVKSLRKAQKEKYSSIKKYVLAHIQEEDFGSEGPGLLIALGGGGHGSNGGNYPNWGQVVDTPPKDKKHKKKTSVSKINKSAPKLMDKSSRLGAPSPKITTDSRFTLTPQGFAELGAHYTAKKEKEKAKAGNKSKAQSRKKTHTGSPVGRKGGKSKSPNNKLDRPRKDRAITIGTASDNRKKLKGRTNSETGRKKKVKASATTDDYTPSRTRERAGTSSRNLRQRPSTARQSKEKKKGKKGNSDSFSKKKAEQEFNSKSKKKSKKKKKEDFMSKMSMQDQARQALCITGHKVMVQAFIEKTENLAGTINFQQFRECLSGLDLDVGKGDALKAFSELDEDKEEGRYLCLCLYVFV